MTHVWSSSLFSLGIIIFPGVLTKFHFFTKFTHLEKFVDLMKNLKYEHQSILPCEGGSNLILGTGTENQIFVYHMGRLCEGAKEISSIKASLFLCGGVGVIGWGGCGAVGGGGLYCGVGGDEVGGGVEVVG